MHQQKVSAPVLYLNALEHEGKPFIRIWHKANPFIGKRLKEATWVRYSNTYKCFVMHRSDHCIELLHRHFEGLARVDSRYLNRPKRLRPDKQTPLLAARALGEPLRRMHELPVVRLQPLLEKGGATVMGVTFKYNEELYRRLLLSKVARWQKELKCFAMPPGGNNILVLADELQGASWLWLNQELQVKDVALMRQLWEQTYEKDAA